jgi:hypothetical protein
LPKLAWVAVVDRPHGVVTLDHGPLVEVRPAFWIEGVWNGPFQHGNFGETDCVFGTGGLLHEGSIRFVPSASTVDCLYYKEEGPHVTVSNSLPLLLASIGDSLDPRCLEYPEICDSIMAGINHYRRDIITKKGKVQRQLYRNLDVSREGVSESEKRMPLRFGCFKEYRDYLRDNYASIVGNARDRARVEPIEILSTQSTGYDTTAVNALAGPYGIAKIFTVTKAKSVGRLAHQAEGEAPDDDGSAICKSLGLSCLPIDRRAFAEGFEEEHLYYCALYHNQDANLLEIGKHISRVSVLLTGKGGAIWNSKSSRAELLREERPGPELTNTDSGGLGMAELRLVAGFIHLPLPYMGARQRRDIVNITESSEMDPWRLGNRYDRPIARRIAEDAGVPRSLFGQSKKGSVVIFCQPAIPYGKALRLEFFQYLADEKIMARTATLLWPIVRWVNTLLMLKSRQRHAVVYVTERVISKLTGRKFQFKRMWSQLDGALYCFCVNRAAKTHAECLQIGRGRELSGVSRLTVSQR